MTNEEIAVSAVVFRDGAARLLTVRKRDTERFMLPGGKPEPGETAEQAAVRECREELGLTIDAADLRLIGRWRAPAANESGRTVHATVFEHPRIDAVAAQSELEEVRWLEVDDAGTGDLAPLLTLHVLPALRTQAS